MRIALARAEWAGAGKSLEPLTCKTVRLHKFLYPQNSGYPYRAYEQSGALRLRARNIPDLVRGEIENYLPVRECYT